MIGHPHREVIPCQSTTAFFTTCGKAGTLLILAVSTMNDDSAGIRLNDSCGRELSNEFQEPNALQPLIAERVKIK